jgi:hypothetical protein
MFTKISNVVTGTLSRSGLPYQKSQIEHILDGLRMNNVGIFTANWYILQQFVIGMLWPFGIFYGHLVYVMAIWYILWPFGIFYGHLVICFFIWYMYFMTV